MQVQKTVFISYRRANKYMARAVYQNLRSHGYDVFYDVEGLGSGDFSQGLMTQIAVRAHFVLILTPSALERCVRIDDWMRREIEFAIEQKRNIVPLMFEGVKFEQVQDFLVSDYLKLLLKYQTLPIPEEDIYFDAAMKLLRGKRYLNRPLEIVLHPVSPQAAQAAQAAQAKADAAPAPTTEQLEAEQLSERAYSKYLLKDYSGAIVDYSAAIRLNPQFAAAFIGRGLVHYQKKEYDRTIADYSAAIRLEPQDAMIYSNRGLAYGNKGEYDQAIADYGVAIRLEPQNAMIYSNRGLIRKAKGDYVGAIADYSKAIRLNPQLAEAYIGRGLVRYDKKEYDQVIADYEAALAIDPNNWLVKENLEKARRQKGRK